MSASPTTEGTDPAVPAPDGAALLARLRSEGASRLDPARFRYLEALARRMDGSPQAVRTQLEKTLAQAVGHYAQRWADTVDARPVFSMSSPARKPRAAAPASPLAQLQAWVQEVSPSVRMTGGDELASLRRFRRAWSASRTRDQVVQAVSRKPANAGPLNSHALVLESLDRMNAIAPDYLRRFVLQVEALQWLERAREKYPPATSKGGKAAKRKAAPRG